MMAVRSTARPSGQQLSTSSATRPLGFSRLSVVCSSTPQGMPLCDANHVVGDGSLAPLNGLNDESISPSAEPQTPVKIKKRIPRRIIQNAAGIAVFTCMRSGLWMTGSGGSGVLIARKSDGTWSPPSGITLHTPTLSFILGVDVYDCVLVMNTLAALESVIRPRVTLGEDVGLAAGPLIPIEAEGDKVRWSDMGNTVFTYMQSRGHHQAVDMRGSILTERSNENERFYNMHISQLDILAGNVMRQVDEVKPLFEVIKMAEGRTDYDEKLMASFAKELAPGDVMIATPTSSIASPRPAFGLPKADDPDPFGILALEMAGLEIREAGSQLRPSSGQLDIHRNSNSVLAKLNRQSGETFATRSNRGSCVSAHTIKSQDAGTQTRTDVVKTPETTPSPTRSVSAAAARHSGVEVDVMERLQRLSQGQPLEIFEERKSEEMLVTEGRVPDQAKPGTEEPKEPEQPRIDDAEEKQPVLLRVDTNLASPEAQGVPTISLEHARDAEEDSISDVSDTKIVMVDDDKDDDLSDIEFGTETNDADDEDDEEEDDIEDEEPVIFEVAQCHHPARTQAVPSRVVHAKAVTIPKRIAPPLPTRSAARNSRTNKVDEGFDAVPMRSPLRLQFAQEVVHHEDGEWSAQSQNTMSELASPTLDSVVAMSMDAETPRSVTDTKQGALTPKSSIDMDRSQAGSETLDLTQDANTDPTTSESTVFDQITPARVSPIDDSMTEKFAEAPLDPIVSPLSPQIAAEETQQVVPQSEANEPSPLSAESVSHEHSDLSDETTSTKRHTSSTFTGTTEDHWNLDRSTVTTPISERGPSRAEETAGDDTPTKEKEKEAARAEEETPVMPGAFVA